MVKTLKAGLMALTILATSAPALAQQEGHGGHGGGNGGGGGERQGNPSGTGYRGGGQAGGASRWNGGNPGGGQPAAPAQAPRPQAPVQAQAPSPGRNWNGNGGGDRQGQWQGQRPQAPNPQAFAPPRPSGNFQNPGQNRDFNRGNNQFDNRNGGPGFGRPDAGRPNAGRPGGYGQPNYGRPGNNWQGGGARINNAERWNGQRRWTNDWRRDNRYDWSRYRQSYRDYYHLPAYRAPAGWGYGYSSFGIGAYLGGPLFSSSYWIDDPYSYRLPPAYGTLRWVRYYNDAMLVDIRDGYVVDVIHDFFW